MPACCLLLVVPAKPVMSNKSIDECLVTGTPQLEWVDGEIWGNVWQTECIARIDPKTGLIRGWILLNGLLDAARRESKGRMIDVLNGEMPNLHDCHP